MSKRNNELVTTTQQLSLW